MGRSLVAEDGGARGVGVMTAYSKGTVPFRGARLSVLSGGTGPRCLYVHGMIGNPTSHTFLERLSETHSVAAPSLPGFNESAMCEDLRGIHDWVVALSEIVDACGCAGAPVVASSIGAMLALELSAVRPEAFSKLILISPLGLWDAAEPVADVYARPAMRTREVVTAHGDRTSAFYEDDPSLDAADQVERGVQRFVTQSTAASLVWPIPEFGLSTRIHRVAAPVALIWGTSDAVAPISYLDRFANSLPNVVNTHRIEGAGHHAEWDAPEEIVEVVRAALGAAR